jgi:hypothetical protein
MSTWVLALTAVHTLLSVVALLLGIDVIRKLLDGSGTSRSTSWFFFTASATTLTGFLFPFHGVTPAIAVGIVSAAILILVFVAKSRAPSSRAWAITRTAGLVISEYLLVFVAIAQAFTKIPALHALAPTLKEPPFGIAQTVALLVFIVLGVLAVRRTGKIKKPYPAASN